MHGGRIDTTATAAGRVYAALLARDGDWIDGWSLTLAAGVSAVSTRVSEVRHALDGTGARVESRQTGRKWFYRVVREPLQMEMGI
jgi:hypothetical protein